MAASLASVAQHERCLRRRPRRHRSLHRVLSAGAGSELQFFALWLNFLSLLLLRPISTLGFLFLPDDAEAVAVALTW